MFTWLKAGRQNGNACAWSPFITTRNAIYIWVPKDEAMPYDLLVGSCTGAVRVLFLETGMKQYIDKKKTILIYIYIYVYIRWTVHGVSTRT